MRGADPPPGAREAIAGLGELRRLVDQGRPAEAENLGRALLDRTVADLGPDSLLVADVLMELVNPMITNGKGRDPATLASAERAHAIQTSRFGASDPAIAPSLMTLGKVYFTRGDYPSARAVYERALGLREGARVPDDETLAGILEGLATIHAETGHYTTARALFERSLGVLDRLAAKRSTSVIRLLNNYGTVLTDLGDFEAARSVFQRGLDQVREELGEDHPLYALLLDNMGASLETTGEVAAARPFFERALAIREARLGPDKPQVAVSLSNLAGVLLDLGDPAGARPLYERALRIREAALGPAHPLVAIPLTGLGQTLLALGEPEAARPLLERALRIREERLGSEHPFFARSLIHLASLGFRTGDEKSALEGALRAEEILRGQIERTVRYLSERQALDYRAIERSGLDVALAAGTAGGRAGRADPWARPLWESVIRSRALILDEVIARHRSLLDRTGPHLASRVQAWDAARARYAALVTGGPGAGSGGDYRELLRRARAETDRAERAVADRSIALRLERRQRSAGIEEIRRAMPPSTALVAYARFEAPPRGDRAAETRYAAFVLAPGRDGPLLANLGPARVIDDFARRFRSEVGAPPTSVSSLATCRDLGAQLRRLVWDPVAAALGEARNVFLVPDGELHLLNFATLPIGQEGYLLDSGHALHYLSAERDILALSEAGRDPAGGARNGGLLGVGGLDFGDRPRTGGGDAARAGRAPADCAGLRDMEFRPLPGSRVEVEEIASLWIETRHTQVPATPDGDVAFLLTGRQGNESEFKKHAPGRRVLHLATHGISLDDICRGPRPGGPEPDAAPDQERGRAFPLFGLALAEANRRSQGTGQAGADDGILTAEEIAALDLRGVEWVVLSGCQTGVGPAFRGEGVLGLRRAFRVAGARTLIMSLWAVSDHDALEWILELYRARLDGRTTPEAARTAARRVLDNRRRAGVIAHPHFWGAFVAAGGWN